MYQLHISNITEVSMTCPQQFLINFDITYENGDFIITEDFTILTHYFFGELKVACAEGIHDINTFPNMLFHIGAYKSIKCGDKFDGNMSIVELLNEFNELPMFSNF